jgi:hypothetical protein
VNRPDTPEHLTHSLRKLGIDMPPEGHVINRHGLDLALKESGASLEQRLRFKSDLREAKLINP